MNRNSVKYNGVCRTLWWGESIGTNLNCAQSYAARMCNVLIVSSRDHGLLSWTNPSLTNHFKLLCCFHMPKRFCYEHHSKHMPGFRKRKRFIYQNNGLLACDAVKLGGCVTSQKTVIFTVTTVRISNLKYNWAMRGSRSKVWEIVEEKGFP
jgi:hypothetical protein